MILVMEEQNVLLTATEECNIQSDLTLPEVIQELVPFENFLDLQLKLQTALAEKEALKVALDDSNQRNLALQRLIVKSNITVPQVPFISMVTNNISTGFCS